MFSTVRYSGEGVYHERFSNAGEGKWGDMDVLEGVGAVASCACGSIAPAEGAGKPAGPQPCFFRALRSRSSSRSRVRLARTSSMPDSIVVPRITPQSMLYS